MPWGEEGTGWDEVHTRQATEEWMERWGWWWRQRSMVQTPLAGGQELFFITRTGKPLLGFKQVTIPLLSWVVNSGSSVRMGCTVEGWDGCMEEVHSWSQISVLEGTLASLCVVPWHWYSPFSYGWVCGSPLIILQWDFGWIILHNVSPTSLVKLRVNGKSKYKLNQSKVAVFTLLTLIRHASPHMSDYMGMVRHGHMLAAGWAWPSPQGPCGHNTWHWKRHNPRDRTTLLRVPEESSGAVVSKFLC